MAPSTSLAVATHCVGNGLTKTQLEPYLGLREKKYNRLYPFKYGANKLIMLNSQDQTIRPTVEAYGEFSEAEVDIFRTFATDNDVIEVGANFGVHTVPLAELASTVLAFEPQSYTYQVLQANLALACVENVKTYNTDVGAKPGTCKLPQLAPYGTENFGSLPALGNSVGKVTNVLSIDSVSPLECDFIKIDVEGNELDVLRGAEHTIDRFSPILYFEYLFNREALLAWMEAHGYIGVRHLPAYHREPNMRGYPCGLCPQHHSDMVLAYREPPALPPEWLAANGFMWPSLEDLWGPREVRYLEDWPRFRNVR